MVNQMRLFDIKEETTRETPILNNTETSSEPMEDLTTETRTDNDTLITKKSDETTSNNEGKNGKDGFLKLL